VRSTLAESAREQLTLIRIFEELRGHGHDGGNDAVRRYARRWSRERGQSTAAVLTSADGPLGRRVIRGVEACGSIAVLLFGVLLLAGNLFL